MLDLVSTALAAPVGRNGGWDVPWFVAVPFFALCIGAILYRRWRRK